MLREKRMIRSMRYSGGAYMIAWLLHRIGGVAMVVFVGLHILAGFMAMSSGSKIGISLNIFYTSWVFQAILYFFVIFHALNGLRLIILDLFPNMIQYHKEALMLQWFLFSPIYAVALFVMVQQGMIGG